jgi:hypothetical protein
MGKQKIEECTAVGCLIIGATKYRAVSCGFLETLLITKSRRNINIASFQAYFFPR